MLGSISQREEELSIRSTEIHNGEQRLIAAQTDLEERLSAMAAREKHIQQREEAIQQREDTVQQREQIIQQREHSVQQREQAFPQRTQAIQQREHNNHSREQAFAVFEEAMLRQLEGNYTSITSTVSQMRRAVSNAQNILTNRRHQVLYHENFSNSLQGTFGQGKCLLVVLSVVSESGLICDIGRYGGSIAIDGAIGALAGLDQMLAQGEINLHAQIHNAIKPQ